MTWLAFYDFAAPPKIEPNFAQNDDTGANLGLLRGSIILEANISIERTTPIVLAEYSALGDWGVRFSLRFDPTERAILEVVTPHGDVKLSVPSGVSVRDRVVKITYSWDVTRRLSLLTLEDLFSGVLYQTQTNSALPIPPRIIKHLTVLRDLSRIDEATSLIAVSDHIQNVGIAPTIASDAMLQAPKGSVPVAELRVGDLVETRDHGPQPILWVGRQNIPSVGKFQPVQLIAPYFGLTQDLLVAPHQRLLISGAEVEYLFGIDEVLVEARHLVNGRIARRNSQHKTMEYWQILLEDHELFDVSGAAMESLFAANIRDDHDLRATTILAELPENKVPLHKKVVRPLLRDYEAISLSSALFL